MIKQEPCCHCQQYWLSHDLADRTCIPPPGVMFGAKKGTQVLDIAHAVQLHLQKGDDNFGEAGLAQGDIATYYLENSSMDRRT